MNLVTSFVIPTMYDVLRFAAGFCLLAIFFGCSMLTQPTPFVPISQAPLPDSDGAWRIAFSPDGKLLTGGRWGGTKLWSVSEQKTLATLKDHWKLLALSPDGQLLAFGQGKRIALWSIEDRQEIGSLDGHRLRVWCAAFSPDGNFLATGTILPRQNINDDARNIRQVDVQRARRPALPVDTDEIAIKLWSIPDGVEIATLNGHRADLVDLAFSPDGLLLASAEVDGTIKLWSVFDREEFATLKGHRNTVQSIAFSPDGQLLASGSWDMTVKLWSVEQRREIATLKGHDRRIYSIAFSPDGELLASGEAGNVILWSVAKRQKVASLAGGRPLAFSPDGRLFACSSQGGIRLWKLTNTQAIR